MKIDLKNMDVFRFVVCVLAFVLIFCFIFMVQTKSVINMQNKLLTKYLEGIEKPEIKETYTPNNYTSNTQKEIEKYNQY